VSITRQHISKCSHGDLRLWSPRRTCKKLAAFTLMCVPSSSRALHRSGLVESRPRMMPSLPLRCATLRSPVNRISYSRPRACIMKIATSLLMARVGTGTEPCDIVLPCIEIALLLILSKAL